jgi:hypothetical protein
VNDNPPLQRFRAEVAVRLGLYVDADDEEDAQQRARRLACDRPGIHPSEIVGVTAVPLSVAEQLCEDNLRTWQETEALRLGSVSQRQRWASDCLPEAELLILVRNELFRPFALCPRKTRRGPSAIRHGTPTWIRDCAVDRSIPVEWRTNPDPDLTDDNWQTLRRLLVAGEAVRRHPWMRSSPPAYVRMQVRNHHGMCLTCRGTSSENTALIEIDWAGRTLSREYVL